MAISIEPLDKMFRSAGMPTDRIIEQVRRGYSGQGGPLTPLSLSTRGEEPSADEARANHLLQQMDQLQRESRKGSIRREQTKGGSERTRNLDNNFLGFPVSGLCPYRFRKAPANAGS